MDSMTLEEAIKAIRNRMDVLHYYEQAELDCLSLVLSAAEKWDKWVKVKAEIDERNSKGGESDEIEAERFNNHRAQIANDVAAYRKAKENKE